MKFAKIPSSIMAGNNDILKYRKEIDKLDNKLLQLLNKRAELSLNIRNEKNKLGEALYDPKRENELIDKLCEDNPGPLYDEDVRELFSNIIKTMRGLPDA